jgi:hypothetical protein
MQQEKGDNEMKIQHTPTPWKVYCGDIILSKDDCTIAHVRTGGTMAVEDWQTKKQANAAHIVKCVNLHEELVNTLEYTLKFLQKNDVQGSESVYSYIQVALDHAKGGV